MQQRAALDRADLPAFDLDVVCRAGEYFLSLLQDLRKSGYISASAAF